MKTFTTTPEEFATGQASAKARDLIRQSRLASRRRGPPKPRPKRVQLPAQVGTISTEDFAVGRPYWVRRALGHRTAPTPQIKPL